MGLRLIGSFIKCTLSVVFVGIMVSLLFFSVFGEGDVDMKAKDLVTLHEREYHEHHEAGVRVLRE